MFGCDSNGAATVLMNEYAILRNVATVVFVQVKLTAKRSGIVLTSAVAQQPATSASA